MKITYQQNPLCTTVKLSEMEVEILRLRVKAEHLQEGLLIARMYLDGTFGKANHGKALDTARSYCAEDRESDFVEHRLKYCLESLMGTHVGDCTCMACSCDKCHTEELLGIDTIPGLWKHGGGAIYAAFSHKENCTIDEAISYLGELRYDRTSWQENTVKSLEWLKQYRQRYFSEAPEAPRCVEVPIVLGT